MNKMNFVSPPTNRVIAPALSAASYKVLGLLRKGHAYRVRGAWRFRGLRAPVKAQAFHPLLTMGLAEHVEIDRCALMRITPAGRSVSADAEKAGPPVAP